MSSLTRLPKPTVFAGGSSVRLMWPEALPGHILEMDMTPAEARDHIERVEFALRTAEHQEQIRKKEILQ